MTNAINFSYFPDPGMPRWRRQTGEGADDEFHGVAPCIRAAMLNGRLEPPALANLTAADLAADILVNLTILSNVR